MRSWLLATTTLLAAAPLAHGQGLSSTPPGWLPQQLNCPGGYREDFRGKNTKSQDTLVCVKGTLHRTYVISSNVVSVSQKLVDVERDSATGLEQWNEYDAWHQPTLKQAAVVQGGRTALNGPYWEVQTSPEGRKFSVEGQVASGMYLGEWKVNDYPTLAPETRIYELYSGAKAHRGASVYFVKRYRRLDGKVVPLELGAWDPKSRVRVGVWTHWLPDGSYETGSYDDNGQRQGLWVRYRPPPQRRFDTLAEGDRTLPMDDNRYYGNGLDSDRLGKALEQFISRQERAYTAAERDSSETGRRAQTDRAESETRLVRSTVGDESLVEMGNYKHGKRDDYFVVRDEQGELTTALFRDGKRSAEFDDLVKPRSPAPPESLESNRNAPKSEPAQAQPSTPQSRPRAAGTR